jgi:ribosomal protein L11 methyltransferase
VTLAALVLDLSGNEADSLSDALLEAGALSVSCDELRAAGEPASLSEPGEPASWGRVRLTALCDSACDPGRLLRRACEASGLAMQQHELHAVPDEDWVARSRSAFAPVRVSSRMWIVPSWHTPPDPRAVNLWLDPGLAFGTGSHASTRLCLRWLERRVAGGETVLDYGCGSGILAIASLKLGAARAVGVDIDPQAVAVAEANARRNNVAGEFFESGALPAFAGDLVVANILANPLKVLAPIIAGRCRAGGYVALSGILVEQTEDVERAYAPWLAFEAPHEEEGWVCLSGRRQ